jgi:hypothetical protein
MTYGYSSMTMEDARREIKANRAAARKLMATPAKARAFLIKAGILSKDGKSLAPRYR